MTMTKAQKAKRKRQRNPSGGVSPARKDALLRRFESTVEQEDLVQSLAVSEDERATALANLMLDPAYRHHSLAKLCQRVGLRYQDVFDLFRRFQFDLALIHMSRRMPELMAQTAEDAMSRDETCVDCDGTGKRDGRMCRGCRGKGTIHVLGDLNCLKLVYETMGLTGGRGMKSP